MSNRLSNTSAARLAASAAIILGAAGACAGNQPSLVSHLHPTYDYKTFNAYHRNRDTLVEVHGNPLGLDRAAFANAVADAMQHRYSAIQTRFTTTPGGSVEKNLRVVMAFNTRPGNLGLCTAKADAEAAIAARAPITVLHAAWCWGDRAESEVTAHIAPVTAVDDPRFRALVSQATRELFPGNKDVLRNSGGKKSDILP